MKQTAIFFGMNAMLYTESMAFLSSFSVVRDGEPKKRDAGRDWILFWVIDRVSSLVSPLNLLLSKGPILLNSMDKSVRLDNPAKEFEAREAMSL